MLKQHFRVLILILILLLIIWLILMRADYMMDEIDQQMPVIGNVSSQVWLEKFPGLITTL